MTTDQTEHSDTEQRQTDWWHRDHPTFTALSGFFTGMLFVTLVPGGFVGLLRLLFEYDTAEELFPLVLVSLVVPDRAARHPAHPTVRHLHGARDGPHRAGGPRRRLARALLPRQARQLTFSG